MIGSEQGDRVPRWNRRRFLTGCVGFGLWTGASYLGESGVRVIAASSLAAAFEERIGPAFAEATDRFLSAEYHGTATVARMVEDGNRRPDVVIGADATLLRTRLTPDHAVWDVEFAANDVVLAYDPGTELGTRLDGDEPWYEVFADAGTGDIVISDPDHHPLGYRSIHLFELAEREYDLDGFRDSMVDKVDRRGGDQQLLTSVESGNHACAVAYRNMAVDHGVPFCALRDAYNFSDPGEADRYATVSYTTAAGETVAGRPVVYNATVPRNAADPDAGREFISTVLERPDLLEAGGLGVPGSFPVMNGRVPEGVIPEEVMAAGRT